MASETDLSGVVIAERYELVRPIGRGGMGVVYEARHVGTRRRCAVKLLSRVELSGDAEVVKRFFREARASGLIESENVVAAFDSGIDASNRVYYVMEYLQGEDLAQTLRRVGLLRTTAALKILVQAASGLVAAHALGIIHRDIKPANLFLTVGPDDVVTVKVLDFGVAKAKLAIFDESADSLTHGGGLLGTPEYMSPEQLKRASSIDEAADVWSLAVVLFQCLTGRTPWSNAETLGELLSAVLTAPVPPIQELAPWLPAELASTVHKALVRDVAGRTGSIRDFHRRLVRLLPEDTRLRWGELAPPSEDERSVSIERLALADTLEGPGDSGSPVAASIRPRKQRLPANAAIAVTVLGVVGGAVWASGARSLSARHAAELANAQASSVAPTASATEPTRAPGRRLFLEVEPRGAAVSVDGVAAEVSDGRVAIEGSVGSAHVVTVAFAGERVEQRVALTIDGLIPARVALAGPRPKLQVPTSRAKQARPNSTAFSLPSLPAAPASPELSQKFE